MALFRKQYVMKAKADSNVEELDKLLADVDQKTEALKVALQKLQEFELSVNFTGLTSGDGKEKRR